MESAQFASLLTNVLMLVFLWSMNLGQGMSFTLQQIAAPLGMRLGGVEASVAAAPAAAPVATKQAARKRA